MTPAPCQRADIAHGAGSSVGAGKWEEERKDPNLEQKLKLKTADGFLVCMIMSNPKREFSHSVVCLAQSENYVLENGALCLEKTAMTMPIRYHTELCGSLTAFAEVSEALNSLCHGRREKEQWDLSSVIFVYEQPAWECHSE